MTPKISLVAFEAREPAFVFVAVPNERGRYVRTDRSVVTVSCLLCGASVGEPCREGHGPAAKYFAGTHAVRRSSAKRKQSVCDDVEGQQDVDAK